MAETRILGFVLKLFAFLLVCGSFMVEADERTIHTEYICPTDIQECKTPINGSYTNIAHITAKGPADTFHWLISSYGIPSVLVAQTSPSTNITIKWNQFFSSDTHERRDSITFSEKPFYSYAIVFTKLIEYNDLNDTADLTDMDQNGDNSSVWLFHDFSKFAWYNSSAISSLNSVVFKSDMGNGTVTLRVKAFNHTARSDDLPHLEITANATEVDFILENVTTSFDNSRFALEMMLLSSDNNSDTVQLNSSQNIDDEHTPGVFEVIDWTSGGKEQKTGAYLQWKPVCYLDEKRSFAHMNRAKEYYLKYPNMTSETHMNHELDKTVAYAFFGDEVYSDSMSITATNVSFGLAKDKFFINTNFTSWTFSIGYGMPPNDAMSSLIIIIISVGLGLPAAIMIAGGVTACLKKKREASASPYSSIQ